MALLLAAFAVLALAISYYGAPTLWVEPLLRINRTMSALEEKTVQIPLHQVHYLDSQATEKLPMSATAQPQVPLVLLHGIFAEKDHWVEFARSLTATYWVLAPDLPGFGESTRDNTLTYDYAAQVKHLHAMLDAWGLERVHLAGSSMGGTVAALFAIEHPDRVASVAFIGAPHGLRSARPSDMDRQIDAGQRSLVAHDSAAFAAMMGLLFAKRPFIPYPILHVSQQDALARAASNERIWDAQLKDRFLLHHRLPELQVPAFGLWGEQDRIFDVSGKDTLHAALPGAQLETLPGIGHLPMMETPGEAAQRYANFLAGLTRAASKPSSAK